MWTTPLTGQDVQDATTREQCAKALSYQGAVVFDSHDHANLAEKLAEYCNLEGLTIEDMIG